MPKNIIVVTGGVISGLGKGIISSSISRILISKGFNSENLKIDPYFNMDAGTLRPTEHGEVWVTKDGGEIDQDLGNYERFTGLETFKKNNLTSGKVFYNVLKKERKGEYLGQTVEFIPHITDEIIQHVEKFNSDFLVVEIGGTVGDYNNIPFLQAMRILKNRGNNIIFIHTSYVPIPSHLGEPKTKPSQHSAKALRESGIDMDFLILRAEKKIDKLRIEKLSLSCNISSERVINSPDTDLIYRVPLILEEQGLSEKIFEILKIKPIKKDLVSWKNLINKYDNLKSELTIGIVGKYIKTGDFDLKDSYLSVEQALLHAGLHNNKKIKIKWIDSKTSKEKDFENISGIIVPGGFGDTGVSGKIFAAKICRTKKIPYLGLCFGLQLAVIEFARNVLGIKNANSEEFKKEGDEIFIKFLKNMEERIQKNGFGSSMRLGDYRADLKEGSYVRKIYGREKIYLRHRHRYEINPEKYEELEKAGFIISGRNPELKVCEFMELKEHPFFIGTQAHPEFNSSFLKPEPLFFEFVKKAINRSQKH